MTTPSEETVSVKCPTCGREIPLTPVTVLRPDDASLGLLFRGTLNQCLCPDCNARFRVDLPLLYRDDARRIVVYCLPAGEQDGSDLEQAEAQVDTILKSIFAGDDVAELPECRLVFTIAEFVEKIALVQAGLDDRLVEYIKYQFFLRRERDLNPARRNLLFDFSHTEPENLGFIVVDRQSGKACAAAHIAMDTYRELAAAFLAQDGLREELRKLFPRYVVSAMRLF